MGGVIKANSQADDGIVIHRPHGASFQFDDLSRKAEAYLAEVRQKAAKIVEQAQADAVKIRSDAMEQGRKAAQAAAEKSLKSQFDQQVQSVLPAVKTIASQVAQAKHVWAKSWETNLVKLAVAISRRVIRREVSQFPEITFDLVREAIDLASGAARIRVLLHPADHASLKSHYDAIRDSMKDLGNIEIVADPAIGQGGCRLETEYGEIDQRIATQLDRIEKELLA